MFAMKVKAYWQLMRFDKPVGTLLLWWPTSWALWIANKGMPPWQLFAYFLAGTILMRAAGCIINDIADRHIDKHVVRTKTRPLTSGALTLPGAFLCLIILLAASLVIVAQLPIMCVYLAVVACFITFLYPFCKRFFQAPQVVLGIAFSMSIPMVYNASHQNFSAPMVALMLITILWVIAYDTIYAMVDRDDDLKIGVKSTAVLLADYDRLVIYLLQVIIHVSWLMLAIVQQFSYWFYIMWFIAGFVLIYQQVLVHRREKEKCFKAFLINNWYGLCIWIGLVYTT